MFALLPWEFLLSDYEEDFEIDELKQDEKEDGEDQDDDQMSRGTKSPTEGEKDNVNPEKELETSSEKALDAHDSENFEDTGCSDSEEDDRQGRLQSVPQCDRNSPFLNKTEMCDLTQEPQPAAPQCISELQRCFLVGLFFLVWGALARSQLRLVLDLCSV